MNRKLLLIVALFLVILEGCDDDSREGRSARTIPAPHSQPAADMPSNNGIEVVCPAIECDERTRTNYPGEASRPIDLVVLGTAKWINRKETEDSEKYANPVYEIEVERVLYGDWSGKIVRMVHPWCISEGRAIFALVSSMYESDGADFLYKYSLPAAERNAQEEFAKARLDCHALSAKWIFIGKDIGGNPDARKVKVVRLIKGKGLKTGDTIPVNLGNFIRQSDGTPRLYPEEMIYFIPDVIKRSWDSDATCYFLSTRIGAAAEPAVRQALARRSKYPVITVERDGKEQKLRVIEFLGSTDEAIRLLNSTHMATIVLVRNTLIRQGKTIHARIEKEIRKRLFSPGLDDANARTQKNLISTLRAIDPKATCALLEDLMDFLESPRTGNDRSNQSLTYLLDELNDGLFLAKHYGPRLMRLRARFDGQQKKVVEQAFRTVQLEDRIELAAAMERSRDLSVVRTVKPKDQPKVKNRRPEPSEIINMFFRPADRATLVFTQDGKKLITVSQSGFIRTRDPQTLKVLHEVKLPKDFMFVGVSPNDGKFSLITRVTKRESNGWPDEFGEFRVINVETGKTLCEVPLRIHWRYTNTRLIWLPKEQLLIIDDGNWYRVDYRKGKILESLSISCSDQNELYNGLGELAEDGRNLFMLGGGGKCQWLDVMVCDLATRKTRKLGKIDLPNGCWCNQRGLVPGGKYFFFGDPGLYIYSRKTLKPVIRPLFPKDDLLALAFSPDGRRVAVVTGASLFVDDQLRIHDSGTKSVLRIHETRTGKTLWAIMAPTRWIRTMAFSPDGNRLAIIRDDSVIEVYTLK